MLQIIKFIIVGVSNTAITTSTYLLLVSLGLNYNLSNVIGYIVGTLNSYIWNKSWVFKQNSSKAKTFVKFIMVNLITLSVNSIVLFELVSKENMGKFIAQLIATVIGMIINYILNKLWTFGGYRNERDSAFGSNTDVL